MYGEGGIPLFPTLDLIFYPEDGGRRFLQNVGNDLPDCMASHSKKTVIFIIIIIIIMVMVVVLMVIIM
jgi:hypothetical protein